MAISSLAVVAHLAVVVAVAKVKANKVTGVIPPVGRKAYLPAVTPPIRVSVVDTIDRELPASKTGIRDCQTIR